MQQHGSKYFARRHSPPPPHDPRRWGQKVKFQLFQNIVMLHIKLKEIEKCRPPPSPPTTLGDGVKIQLFQNMVVLHIKLKGIINAATNRSKYFVCSQPPPPLHQDPRGWGQTVKIQLFQNMVMLHIKLKAVTNAATW